MRIKKEDFVYVPPINLYVSKQKSHTNLNWYETHASLHKEGLLMPTIPQFVAFIYYLSENPQVIQNASSSELESILDEILKIREPPRGIWLDAYFKSINEKSYIHYNHRTDSNGNLVPHCKEIYEDWVDDWSMNPEKYGMPKIDVKSKKFVVGFWGPKKDYESVARYNTDAGLRSNALYLHMDPTYHNALVGVYSVYEATTIQ